MWLRAGLERHLPRFLNSVTATAVELVSNKQNVSSAAKELRPRVWDCIVRSLKMFPSNCVTLRFAPRQLSFCLGILAICKCRRIFLRGNRTANQGTKGADSELAHLC